jgi:hypothetical protein
VIGRDRGKGRDNRAGSQEVFQGWPQLAGWPAFAPGDDDRRPVRRAIAAVFKPAGDGGGIAQASGEDARMGGCGGYRRAIGGWQDQPTRDRRRQQAGRRERPGVAGTGLVAGQGQDCVAGSGECLEAGRWPGVRVDRSTAADPDRDGSAEREDINDHQRTPGLAGCLRSGQSPLEPDRGPKLRTGHGAVHALSGSARAMSRIGGD